MLGRSKPATISPSSGMPSWVEDVGPGARVGGRGQRQPRHVAMVVEQGAQLAIVGAEVMPPFADAMRLVDRDQRQRHLVDQPPEALGRRPLGRDIEQVELAGAEALDASPRGRCRPRSARPRGCRSPRRADLVVHQRDQRRDDQRGAVAGQRRQLVAERLARPVGITASVGCPAITRSTTCSCTPRNASKPKVLVEDFGSVTVTPPLPLSSSSSARSAAWRAHSSA